MTVHKNHRTRRLLKLARKVHVHQVCGLGTFIKLARQALRLRCRTWALSGAFGAGSGNADRSATLKTRRSPTSATLFPGNGCARRSSSWWSSSLAKGLRRRRTRRSWTSLLLFTGLEAAGGVMTKLIERNTTTPMKRNTDVHDAC